MLIRGESDHVQEVVNTGTAFVQLLDRIQLCCHSGSSLVYILDLLHRGISFIWNAGRLLQV